MRAATISAVALAACGAGVGASPLVAPPRQRVVTRAASSPVDVDSFVFLQNEHVRLGIDISRGGAIGWFGPRGNASLSLLNIHDFGREVQGSFYSGPDPYNPDGKCSEPGGWGRPWPWNPIGAGDVYHHAAPVMNLTRSADNTSATVWSLPYQWACDTVPCDCYFRQDIRLVGSAVEVALTLVPFRADKTFYSASTQELPAVYITGDFCHLWTFNSTTEVAWSGAPATEQPAVWGTNAWGAFTSAERWMAFTNASGWGVGVVSPFVSHFGAGFFNEGQIGTYDCIPHGYGPYDDPTGYIAPWMPEILDPITPYTYEFALVLGSLPEIRAYAAAQHAAGADEPQVPLYDFVSRASRVHCTFSDASDSGLPVPATGLSLNITGPHPGVLGPISVFPPTGLRHMRVVATYDSTFAGGIAAVLWRVAGSTADVDGMVTLPVIADGVQHTYDFDVGAEPAWSGADAIVQVLFQPLGSAPVTVRGAGVHVASIAAVA